MASLASLPAEVLLHVCKEVSGADDLARLSMTCTTFNSLIDGNTILYKHLYLNLWDDPLDYPVDRREPDWINDSKDIAKVLKILRSQEEDRPAADKILVADTLAKFLNFTNKTNKKNNKDVIKEAMPQDSSRLWSLICQSHIYSRASGLVATQQTDEDRQKAQASAHLHCLYGVPQIEYRQGMHMQPYALSKVYDMRQYDEDRNGWGPFLDDGSWSVDWEKLESIMIDLAYNIRRLSRGEDLWISKLWSEPFKGNFPYSYTPMRPRCPHARASPEEDKEEEGAAGKKPKRKLDEQDPYGITGTYLRIVCFLDYRVLFNYNWGERRPRRIDDPMPIINEDEATRLIAMSIAVDRIEWPKNEADDAKSTAKTPAKRNDLTEHTNDVDVQTTASSSLETQTADHSYGTRSAEHKKKKAKKDRANKMPIVHFSGTSRAMHVGYDPNANSRIKGTVRTTPDGEVRWTTVSIFDNDEERWKSEGIQLGGLQSGRGVLGNWFDVNYDAHGPAGPTAFWKIQDEIPESLNEEEMEFDTDSDSEAGMLFEDDSEEVEEEEEEVEEEEQMHHLLLDDEVELVLVAAHSDQ